MPWQKITKLKGERTGEENHLNTAHGGQTCLQGPPGRTLLRAPILSRATVTHLLSLTSVSGRQREGASRSAFKPLL